MCDSMVKKVFTGKCTSVKMQLEVKVWASVTLVKEACTKTRGPFLITVIIGIRGKYLK